MYVIFVAFGAASLLPHGQPLSRAGSFHFILCRPPSNGGSMDIKPVSIEIITVNCTVFRATQTQTKTRGSALLHSLAALPPTGGANKYNLRFIEPISVPKVTLKITLPDVP